jgi:hypothetical protein
MYMYTHMTQRGGHPWSGCRLITESSGRHEALVSSSPAFARADMAVASHCALYTVLNLVLNSKMLKYILVHALESERC